MLPKFSFMKDLKIFYYISMFTLHKSFTNVDLDCIFFLFAGTYERKWNLSWRNIYRIGAIGFENIFFCTLFHTNFYNPNEILWLRHVFFCSFQAFLFIFIKNYTNINNNIVVQCSMAFWRLSLSGTSNQWNKHKRKLWAAKEKYLLFKLLILLKIFTNNN